jgi:hypothetical protein
MPVTDDVYEFDIEIAQFGSTPPFHLRLFWQALEYLCGGERLNISGGYSSQTIITLDGRRLTRMTVPRSVAIGVWQENFYSPLPPGLGLAATAARRDRNARQRARR